MRDVAGRIDSFVREQFGVAADDPRFGDEVNLFDAGYVDSVGIVELLSFLQEEFGVEIPERELMSDEFATTSGIASIVSRLSAVDASGDGDGAGPS